MPIALSTLDKYRVTVKQVFNGVLFENVFFCSVSNTTLETAVGSSYVPVDGKATYQHLGEAVVNHVWGQVLSKLAGSHGFREVVVEQLDPTGQSAVAGETWPVVGVYNSARNTSTQPMQSFVALNYKQLRTNISQRHGFKRLTGFTEDALNGNSLADGDLINFVAPKLAGGFAIPRPASIPDGIINPADGVMLVRNVYQNGQPLPARFYPPSAAVFTGVTTQKSRQR